jgi:hypothetical protein
VRGSNLGSIYVDRELREIEKAQKHRDGVALADGTASPPGRGGSGLHRAAPPPQSSRAFRPYRGEGIVDLEMAAKESVIARGNRMAANRRHEQPCVDGFALGRVFR